MTNGWDMGGTGCAGGMAMMWLAGLLLLGGVVVLAVVVVRAFSGRSQDKGRTGTGAGFGRGREVLEERYARGELSTEEYRERLRVLDDDGR